MLLYLLKRTLLALPSLWLIVTLAFLLSRMLPGRFGSENILKESESFYSSGQAATRTASYLSYLQKTGQHLPLFYVSICSAAEPATGFPLLPEHEQDFLKKLSFAYGTPSLSVNYFLHIKALEEDLKQKEQTEKQHLISELYKQVEPDSIRAAVIAIAAISGNTSTSALQEAAEALIRQKQPLMALIPVLHWHGTQNQYHLWLTNLLQGNLGNSLRDNRPVTSIIIEAVLTTTLLLLTSMLITITLAMELSIFMLKQGGKRWHKIILPFLFVFDRIPIFLIALLLLIVFASPDYLPIFPVYGLGYHTGTDTSWMTEMYFTIPYLVLPAFCLITVNLPYLTNQFYRSLADTSQLEFVKTAQAKGLSEGKVIRRHIFRNALLPVITLLSDFIPALVAGAVVIEAVFALPGMGSLLVQAVQARDYPVVIGIVLVVALAKIFSHLLADLLYSYADPRIRFARS